MQRTKTVRWLAAAFVAVMLLAAFPGVAYGQNGDYAFIPNSGEASVSKVDLVTGGTVARYWTAPRTPVDPRSWRTSRIAMDAGGNAWVLNVGGDAYLYGPAAGLVGQVVRIQGDTSSLGTTNNDHATPLAFGTDEAVQVFPVGGLDAMPRAIAICPTDPTCIWVGFYGSGELAKYQYDEGTAALGDETFTKLESYYPPAGTKLNYYEMKFAPDGTLFISSRSSTPTRAGTYGVWSFDTSTGTFTSEWVVSSPYSLLISDTGQVYATSYSNTLWIRGSGTVAINGAQNLRGMAFDNAGKIWIASTTGGSGGDRVCWYDPSNGTSGYITLTVGNTPVGLGMDASGLMWVVCRTDNMAAGYIEAFDPTVGQGTVASIQVGFRPYAYGDFSQDGECPPGLTPKQICQVLPVGVKVHPAISVSTSVDVLEYNCANPLTNSDISLAFDWLIKSNVPWWTRIEWTGLALGTYDEVNHTWLTEPGTGYLFDSFATGQDGYPVPGVYEQVQLNDSVDVGRIAVTVDGIPVSNPHWSQVMGDADTHEQTKKVGYQVKFNDCDTAGWYGGYIWLCAYQN